MYNASQEENKILEFWQKDKTFEKSVSERPEDKQYVFYDGPPFATGLPHYGHILSSVIKDVVPRYWTMKGYKVRRRWGWDCHGLPIENLIEKELKISGKKEIENWGIEKFNEACRSKVLLYTGEWKKMVDRIGRWVEFDNAYKTMDSTYMESVWWSLKKIWDEGRIYEGRKVLMYCPHCETPVSKAEVAMDNSYKEITEEAVTVKFKVKDTKKNNLPENTYILAWTTTPWTLPGNVALAVNKEIDYVLVYIIGEGFADSEKVEGEKVKIGNNLQYFILAKSRLDAVLVKSGKEFEIMEEFKGSNLVGIEYEPLFDLSSVIETGKKAYYVSAADFVTTEDGTGVVHTAVIYGEDDFQLGVKLDLPMVPMLNEKGEFNIAGPEFVVGKYFKQGEKDIKKNLEERGLLFVREQNTHSYPHCWRCETQLIYNAISAWFINIQKTKQRLIELNEKINWFPEHLKHGRFLNILETAPDWNISRNRFWATPLPFWKCDNEECGNATCVGSLQELKEKSTNFFEVFSSEKVEEVDLHKHVVDRIKLLCKKCESPMTRIPEVIDCWVESGSMPFAEFHYPFENVEIFEKRFPGQYIAEYIAQTRAWFYYMHAMSVQLFDNISFENVVCTGTILNEKGEKLSKSKRNYTDPWIIIEQYGVDALRYYLMTSVVMQADDLYFSDREVKDVYNKVINMLWNVVTFYEMYAKHYDGKTKPGQSGNLLDAWIMSRLNELVKETTIQMDNYDTVRAGRPIKDFIDDLSTWYLRRSRDRFKGENEEDKQSALATLKKVLMTLSKVMAPFTPFISEKVFQSVSQKISSVHLEEWPKAEKVNTSVLEEMQTVRKLVEMGLAQRAETAIKIRQVLGAFSTNIKVSEEGKQILADELNVKKVLVQDKFDETWKIKEEGNIKTALMTEITPELKKEGLLREIIRTINQIRKEMKLTIEDKVLVQYDTNDDLLGEVFSSYNAEIQKNVLADRIEVGSGGTSIMIDERSVALSVIKI